jgi:hypothetical protein
MRRENQRVHIVEQAFLYRTGYVTILMNSDFLIELFVHCSSLMHFIVCIEERYALYECMKIKNISMDSGAVFHEESEYVVGFLI